MFFDVFCVFYRFRVFLRSWGETDVTATLKVDETIPMVTFSAQTDRKSYVSCKFHATALPRYRTTVPCRRFRSRAVGRVESLDGGHLPKLRKFWFWHFSAFFAFCYRFRVFLRSWGETDVTVTLKVDETIPMVTFSAQTDRKSYVSCKFHATALPYYRTVQAISEPTFRGDAPIGAYLNS